jgi:tetratricopeptide (TPR) repeat protein
MNYARKLSPDNLEVLALLGRCADELGKTKEAIEALEAYIKISGPDRAGPEITGRLGAIYLRLGERDTAIRWLRYAQGPATSGQNVHALVHLANAFAARGEVSAAVDTLVAAMPQSFNMYSYMNEGTIVAFALAVIYDRDEQRGAAFEVLEKMQSQMQTAYSQTVSNDISKLRFAPAEDQHYYQALLYESVGHYIEARAEWALYAASTDSPWRARALEHIALIDKQRRIDPSNKPTQIPVNPAIRRPRRPHP